MITINYQTFGNKGFRLRLRLYQNGETKFINVTKLLKGAIQKRHWNRKKQLFIPSCPFSDENNSMLVQFRQKYDEMAINRTGSVFGMIAAMDAATAPSEDMTVAGFIRVIIKRLNENRHEDGTAKGSFEDYEKLGNLHACYRTGQCSRRRFQSRSSVWSVLLCTTSLYAFPFHKIL